MKGFAPWQPLMEKAFWEGGALPSPIPTKSSQRSGCWFCLHRRWKPGLHAGNREGAVWEHILASSFRFSLEWNPCSNRICWGQSLLIWPGWFTFVNLKQNLVYRKSSVITCQMNDASRSLVPIIEKHMRATYKSGGKSDKVLYRSPDPMLLFYWRRTYWERWFLGVPDSASVAELGL